MNIVNPIDNNQYSIFSKTGRTLLKLYLRNFKNGGDITFEKMLNSPDDLNRSINQLYNSNLENSEMMMDIMREIDKERAEALGLDPNFSADAIPAICDKNGLCY